MGRPKKNSRKAQEKDLGPRRSNRTPKLSEKLKEYLDDQAEEAFEQETRKSGRPRKISKKLKEYFNDAGSTKKQRKLDFAEADVLGDEYKEAKVVLKALSKSAIQTQSKKYGLKVEPRVTLKRIGNVSGGRKNARVVSTSGLLKRRAVPTKAASNSSQSALRVRQNSLPSTRGPVPQRRGRKRKRLDIEQEPKPAAKQAKRGRPKKKVQDDSPQLKATSRFDPTVMEKLFDFGASVEEFLTLNSKAMDKLVKSNEKAEATTQAINKKLEDASGGDLEKIMRWLEEEERQRKEHREAVMESLRVTHNTNMALYKQMLTVLKSVTASA